MINKYVLIFSLLLFCSSFAFANLLVNNLETDNSKLIKVDSIAIIGNEITNEVIILRELNFHTGDYVDKDILNYNKERVYSLSLFTSVKIYPQLTDTLNIIYIEVQESWYVWPIPYAYRNDNTFNKITYGLNVLYKNFRGMNESLSANVSLGYNPGYSFSYYNPYIDRERQISFSAGTAYWTSSNLSTLAEFEYGKSFSYKMRAGWITVGKRINVYNDAYFSAGYDYIEAPDSSKGNITASGDRIDNVFKIGINYTYDTRNLKQFPDSGIYASINYNKKGFGIDNINYSTLKVDFRHYFRLIYDLTAKWRIAGRFVLGSTNKIPYYDLSFLGYGERVRGHSNDRREGDYLYLGSIELKYPLIKEWDINFKLPIIPKELTSYRVALYPNLFFDTGAVQFKDSEIQLDNKIIRLRYNKFSLNNFYSGYGAGLIFLILPYNILRLELAFDEHTKAEYNIEFGFSF